jgi:predicted nucleotidyltransferase
MTTPERPLQTEAILRALVESQVEFVVVGGVAVQAHGYLRATGDLDVVPEPTLLNLRRLSEALAGLDVRADPHTLQAAPQVRLATRHGRLDILNLEHLVGAPSTFEALRQRALVVDLDGFAVPVAGLDDLVRMKRAAGRPHDLLDIGALTRTDEELDAEAREST